MAKSRRVVPRRVKFNRLIAKIEKSIIGWLSATEGFFCKIDHIRGKKLHLAVWPGGGRRLGFLEREKIQNIVLLQMQSFGLAVEKLIAQARGVYCCIRMGPSAFT